MVKTDIYINGVRVGEATKFDHKKTKENTKTPTFDGTKIKEDDSPNFTLDISKLDTQDVITENGFLKVINGVGGYPIIAKRGKKVTTCTGCYLSSFNGADTPKDGTFDVSFDAEKVEVAYKN